MSRLCFATGCRFCSLCSQQGLLWRNLITLFFTVNNPGEKFSHGAPRQPRPDPLGEHRQAHAPTPRAHRNATRCAPRLKRKPLKRSTFVFSACTQHAHVHAPAPTPGHAPGVPHTAPKRMQKLFTSSIAFCHRICANAQTFRRSRLPVQHRLDALHAPRVTRLRPSNARTTTPGCALMTNAEAHRTGAHEHLHGARWRPATSVFHHVRITMAPTATAQAKERLFSRLRGRA